MVEDYLGAFPVDVARLARRLVPYAGTVLLLAVSFSFFGLLAHRFGSEYLVGGASPSHSLLDFYDRFGVVPALIGHTSSRYFAWLSSLFIHVGPLHLLANVAFLLPFGALSERRCGTLWHCALFLAAGVVAGVVHCWAYPSSHLSLVGASGAVASLAGFVWVAVPLRSPVWSRRSPDAPAFLRCRVVLAAWVFFQLLAILGDVLGGGGGPAAFLSHLVGFTVGLAAGLVCRLADPPVAPADEIDLR